MSEDILTYRDFRRLS